MTKFQNIDVLHRRVSTTAFQLKYIGLLIGVGIYLSFSYTIYIHQFRWNINIPEDALEKS